jgi:putative photosynthetic complex assembly protein
MSGAALRPARQPLGLPIAAAAVICGTLLLTVGGHRAPLDPATTGARPLMERELRFADRADGGISVTDLRSGRVIEALPAGGEGFLRGAMRGLARDRLRAGGTPDLPFRLRAWEDGRLTLEDSATGHVVELHAFGHGNAAAFLRLLTTEEE